MQVLVFLTIFLTVISATTINFFDAQVDVPLSGPQWTIFDKSIELWAHVTGCPAPSCLCDVETNATENKLPMTFSNSESDRGHIKIDNLQPNTLYSFTLMCVGTAQTATCLIRSDYGRPSAPQNLAHKLNSKRLQISWSAPLNPAGPISSYNITINRQEPVISLANNIFSYELPEDLIYEKQYDIALTACNKNRENNFVCSNPNDAKISFIMPLTTTPKGSATTTKSSIIFLLMLLYISIFCFFDSMKY